MNRATMRAVLNNASRIGGKKIIHMSLPPEVVREKLSEKFHIPKTERKKKK